LKDVGSIVVEGWLRDWLIGKKSRRSRSMNAIIAKMAMTDAINARIIVIPKKGRTTDLSVDLEEVID
jgi:hypothetical protein